MKRMMLLVLCVLLLVACGDQPPTVVYVTQEPIVVTATPAPRPTVVQDDMTKFARYAGDLGLVFDGKEDCATSGETDGAWYANFPGQYNLCFAVVNGRANSIGGFVAVGGNTAGFGYDFAMLTLQMGWPDGLLEEVKQALLNQNWGHHYWGDYSYWVQPSENMDAIMVGISGAP